MHQLTADQRLTHCELKLRSRALGLQRGDHLARIAGEGLEARDVREYQPGDDVRQMSWPVTARTGVPHVSTFDAERELTVWILVDSSASMRWGTARMTKADLALDVVAGLCLLVARRGNRIGGGPMAGARLDMVRPRAGRVAAIALIRKISTVLYGPREPGRFTRGHEELGLALRRNGAALRRRGLVVVISDFLDAGFERPLGALARRHEVIAVRTTDPRELELTDVGLAYLRNPETGDVHEVDTSNPHVRAIYSASAETQSRRIGEAVLRSGAAFLDLSTSRDWLDDLLAFIDAYPGHR